MNPGEIVRTALAEIRGHKLRSGLTLLGIILGTLSITVMTSFLDGIVTMVWKGFEDLGFDGVLYVEGRDASDLKDQAVFTRSRGLQPSDANLVLARKERIQDVAPIAFTEEIVQRGNVERKAQVMGCTPAYLVVRSRRIAAGRFLSDRDESAFARVCVLGHRLRERLFGTEDPIGKTVEIGGRAFRIVGVGTKLGNQFVNDSDFIEEMEGLYVPLSTLRKFYTGEDDPLAILAVKTNDVKHLGDVQSELTSSLRIAHHGAQDFRVQNIAEQMLRERQQVTEVIRSWRIVLGSLAGISLVVGGIGLLSVMLIAIGERLYEIGLRKALGATDAEVFLQFLMESVALSLSGGLVGAGCGAILTKLAGSFFPAGLPIHLGGLAFAIGISIALGVVYGIYPALKAARMEPVESLRSAA